MKLRRHLTYANVISTFCLFLVLGGGAAFAATKLAKSSVGTEQLKGEAVTKGKMAPNSVNSKKVVNGSLTGEDIASSTLGKVPSATNAEHADSATTAGSANSASTATNASHATTADTAANAEKLDGHTPSEFGAVLVSNPELPTASVEGEVYFSVSGTAAAAVAVERERVFSILPNRKFRAGEFAIHLEGEAQAVISVHASLVVNGAETEVCTLTAVPSTCTPSTIVEIPAGAQVAWKMTTAAPVEEVRPTLALRLGPS
jgi:hypothetical protein